MAVRVQLYKGGGEMIVLCCGLLGALFFPLTGGFRNFIG